MKSTYIFKNIKDEKFKGVKVIKQNDLPIRLGENGPIIYSLELTQRRAGTFVVMRSTQRGIPIEFLVGNDFAKGRSHVDNAFENNGDKTGMSYYPEVTATDKFQNGAYVENYDYTKFKFEQADYILFSAAELTDYAVMIINPFK
ncbi:hypothetical protein QUF95_22940 [Paenibacillus silvae]|nr:hypothetical protein [Paenibacillus silvae]